MLNLMIVSLLAAERRAFPQKRPLRNEVLLSEGKNQPEIKVYTFCSKNAMGPDAAARIVKLWDLKDDVHVASYNYENNELTIKMEMKKNIDNTEVENECKKILGDNFSHYDCVSDTDSNVSEFLTRWYGLIGFSAYQNDITPIANIFTMEGRMIKCEKGTTRNGATEIDLVKENIDNVHLHKGCLSLISKGRVRDVLYFQNEKEARKNLILVSNELKCKPSLDQPVIFEERVRIKYPGETNESHYCICTMKASIIIFHDEELNTITSYDMKESVDKEVLKDNTITLFLNDGRKMTVIAESQEKANMMASDFAKYGECKIERVLEDAAQMEF